MASAPLFTPTEDTIIRTMRGDGSDWRTIARRVGKSHVGCRRRWVAMGGTLGRIRASTPCAQPASQRKQSMEAGDSISWGALTRGTVLEGQCFRQVR